MPTPPPMQTTWPNFSTCVGCAERAGQVQHILADLQLRRVRWWCADRLEDDGDVTRPQRRESTMVSGNRSPVSLSRRMTNWPGLRLAAMSRASRRMRKIAGANALFSMILLIGLLKKNALVEPPRATRANFPSHNPPSGSILYVRGRGRSRRGGLCLRATAKENEP